MCVCTWSISTLYSRNLVGLYVDDYNTCILVHSGVFYSVAGLTIGGGNKMSSKGHGELE